ncbi:hypothetical protein [Faecalibacillus intestinalis]
MSIIVKLTEKKGFSTAESKIADYIIANKEEILHLTVRELAKAYKDYLDLAKGENISDEEIGRLLKEVTEFNSSIESYVIYSKDELNELYQFMLAYEEKDYTKDSFVGFKDQLNTLKDVIDQAIASFDGVQLVQSKYTKESWDKLQETLQKAKDLLQKKMFLKKN